MFGSLASGLVSQIALWHAQVVGAIATVARTGPRLCDDGDRGYSRSGSARLGAKLLLDARFQGFTDALLLPNAGVKLVLVQVVGEKRSLFHRSIRRHNSRVLLSNKPKKLLLGKLALLARKLSGKL